MLRKYLPLIVIFIFALFIRIYKLETFPLGFHVDEAKVAWEAYSILKTGKDDHGNFLPLYYNSFGDYRPTGIFYTTIPALIIFGRNNFSVRFSSAFLGAATVIPIYFITLQVLKGQKKLTPSNNRVAAAASFLFAIVPWSITTSRATSEVGISCFLILSSLALIKKKPFLSFILLSTSFLVYHSARVMGPLLMLVWIVYLWPRWKLNIQAGRKIVIGLLVTTFLSLILLLSPAGLARYDQVKLTSPNLRNIIIQYVSYFDPNFLIGDVAKPSRYMTANVGIISIPIFVLFLLGIYLLIRTNKNKIVLLFLSLGPIPASLTLEDSPNLHRAFFMLPFLIIISAIGFNFLVEKHKLLSRFFVIALFISFVSFISNYTDMTNNFAFLYRDPQTKRLALYLDSVKNSYDKIYVTNDPDSPYPWYGFFNNIDPSKFNLAQEKNVDGKWEYGHFVWSNTKCPAGKAFDEIKKSSTSSGRAMKIMVVDNGACFTDFGEIPKIIKELDYNGHVNYRIWEYAPTKN